MDYPRVDLMEEDFVALILNTSEHSLHYWVASHFFWVDKVQ